MILRYAYLRQHPHVFQGMRGLTVVLFDQLGGDVRPRLAAAIHTAPLPHPGGAGLLLGGQRQRRLAPAPRGAAAAGGGRP